MEARLVGIYTALFFAAYAGTTPLFSFFGVRVNVALALGVCVVLFFESLHECALLVCAAVAGSFVGADFSTGILFFGSSFVGAYGMRRILPWRPFLVGLVMVVFFSFFPYVSWDMALMARLAPQFGREALYNVTVFAALYALIPHSYARKGRRY